MLVYQRVWSLPPYPAPCNHTPRPHAWYDATSSQPTHEVILDLSPIIAGWYGPSSWRIPERKITIKHNLNHNHEKCLYQRISSKHNQNHIIAPLIINYHSFTMMVIWMAQWLKIPTSSTGLWHLISTWCFIGRLGGCKPGIKGQWTIWVLR